MLPMRHRPLDLKQSSLKMSAMKKTGMTPGWNKALQKNDKYEKNTDCLCRSYVDARCVMP